MHRLSLSSSSITACLSFCTGMFYYILGNIQPKLRSSLKCIQLIACVSVPDLKKYGFDMILRPFISDANKLYEVHARALNTSIHVHIKLI